MKIIEIINKIEAEKKERNTYPHYALVFEVMQIAYKHFPAGTGEIVKQELEELQKQGVIKLGQTINDNYITILKAI